MKACIGIAGPAALAIGLLAGSPAAAQGFTDFLRNSGSTAYAPVPDQIQPATPSVPLSIVPTTPGAGDVAPGKKQGGRAGRAARPPVITPVPTGNPFEEDEDADVVFEHDTPKLVRIALPEGSAG